MFGILFWTLMEYSLHRFIFHWHPNPNSKQQLTLHFLLVKIFIFCLNFSLFF